MAYEPKSIDQLKADYSRRKREGSNSFESFDDFHSWYDKQEKKCYFCGLTEQESQQIVKTGILTSNRFPQNGKIGRGQARGVWLEVDRLQPKGKYSRENCVLCCYFCNNDKSDVFHGDEYKDFIADRPGYLRQKIKDSK